MKDKKLRSRTTEETIVWTMRKWKWPRDMAIAFIARFPEVVGKTYEAEKGNNV